MNAQDKNPPTPVSVTTGPIGGSRKRYSSPPDAPGLAVPYREIAFDPASGEAPLRIYDSSGPYGCAEFAPDLSAGLPSARPWLKSREGLETYEGREVKPEDNGFVGLEHLAPPCPASSRPLLRAAGSRPVTQLEFARARIVPGEMRYVAHRENLCREHAIVAAAARIADGESLGAAIPEFMTPEFVLGEIARAGDHPRQHQPSRGRTDDHRPNFLVKVNASIGDSAVTSSVAERSRKSYGRSTGTPTRPSTLRRPQHPQHPRLDHPLRFTVPIRTMPDLSGTGRRSTATRFSSSWEIFRDTLIEQGEQGVDYFTVHAGVRLAYVPLTAGRVTGIVSRGGSIMAHWCLPSITRELPLRAFRRNLDIMSGYDVCFSLGDGLRPGSIADANDAAQFAELETLGELTKLAWDMGCQVMIEGTGHVPMHKIKADMDKRLEVCREAPFYILGPLQPDVAPGSTTSPAAIGTAMIGWSAPRCFAMSRPKSVLACHNAEDVKQGLDLRSEWRTRR